MSEGFGYRDIEKKLSVTKDTLFPIGSCTKAFTAFSACLLVERGKLNLDKPLRNYFPQLLLSDPYITENVTMRDLLCHRTGLPPHNLVWYYTDFTRDEIVNKLRFLDFSCGFREKFQYCNPMYTLAGRIIGEISGGTWEEFVQKNIFDPLDMKYSNFTPEAYEKSPNHAVGYCLDKESADKIPKDIFTLPLKKTDYEATNIQAAGPCGSINSNVIDMEKWLRLQLNEGCIKKKRLMKRALFLQMHSPQMPTGEVFVKGLGITPASYCLGWGSFSYRGYYVVQHTGGIDGFSSIVSFMPDKNTGIVILTNMNSTKFTSAVVHKVYDRFLKLPKKDWVKQYLYVENVILQLKKRQLKKENDNRKKNTKPTLPIEGYTGTYQHPAFEKCTVELEGISLKLKTLNREIPLKHYHYDTFRAWSGNPLDDYDFKVTFNINEKGEVESLDVLFAPGTDPVKYIKRKTNGN